MALAGLSVSSIAWPHGEFESALSLLRSLDVSGVEIAPRMLFTSWDVAPEEVNDVRRRLDSEGLQCPALQGILFDTPYALFGGDGSRRELVTHLEKVASIASALGAGSCVFGAPRQRDVGDLSDAESREIAIGYFRSVAPVFADRGTSLAIEANAKDYGCNFLTTTEEAAGFVEEIDTPGISLQIDTGTIFLAGESPDILLRAAPVASHAHVSEPELRPVASTDLDHSSIATALSRSHYDGWLSIEMRCTPEWRENIRRAVALLRDVYV